MDRGNWLGDSERSLTFPWIQHLWSSKWRCEKQFAGPGLLSAHWRHPDNPVPILYHPLTLAQILLFLMTKTLQFLLINFYLNLDEKNILPVACFSQRHQFAEYFDSLFKGGIEGRPPHLLPSPAVVSLLTRAWVAASACFTHSQPFILFLMTPSFLAPCARQTFQSGFHNKELCAAGHHHVTSAGKIEGVKPRLGWRSS